MAWLAAHMWAILAGAAALGLLFGWAFRGILLKGKARRAHVERDVAQTELAQARDEIEGLYAAQRKGGAVSTAAPIASVTGETKDGASRLKELAEELARSKAELAALQAGGNGKTAALATGAAIVGAGSATALGDDAISEEDHPSLVWRNRHLESRVRSLETKIHDMAEGAPAQTVAAIPGAAAPEANVDMEKLQFKNTELQQRVNELEEQIISGGGAALQAEQGADTPDEELARLRWRNRFLEGRLAYFEGDEGAEQASEGGKAGLVAGAVGAVIAGTAAFAGEASEGVAELDEDAGEAAETAIADSVEDLTSGGDSVEDITEGLQELAAESAEAVEEDIAEVAEDLIGDATEVGEEAVEDITDEMAAEIESAVSEDADAIASGDIETDEVDTDVTEEAAAELPGIAPLKLDGPVGGHPDDLTAIGGVGPKIQEVLNELGIYHYDQIAAWTPDNVSWVDEHLSFSGRIGREDWVGQASALTGADVDA